MPVNSAKNKVNINKDNYAGMKVLIMGLGLLGGGVESARYLAERGAEVTVTDLRSEEALAPSIEQLKDLPIRFVFKQHNIEDFRNADFIVKNPGVRPDSPYLEAAKQIETDISIFLANNPARLLAVTGSKGKSSTSTALYHVLNESRAFEGEIGQTSRNSCGKVYLGGNITKSPLSFLDELEERDDVVLELSSWQLGDLPNLSFLKPRAAVITPIMRDHLDRYACMEAYISDKKLIYRNQDINDVTIACDDNWGRSFIKESRGRPLLYSSKPLDEGVSGGWIPERDGPGFARFCNNPNPCNTNSNGETSRALEVVPARLLVPGFHQKQNLLAAALALLDIGLPPDFIRESLGRFPGIEHRLEFFHESGGVKFYNDSASTIPEAAVAALAAFEKPPILVAGGADKNLDFTLLAGAAKNAKALILLSGTGTEKLKILLDGGGVKYRGPFDSLESAANAALDAAVPGDTVVLSPGCTSFGMFMNEFERGSKWKETVRKATQ
jgi:UDP-N-acetylmuramoylalanine--D-glutamate ligase